MSLRLQAFMGAMDRFAPFSKVWGSIVLLTFTRLAESGQLSFLRIGEVWRRYDYSRYQLGSDIISAGISIFKYFAPLGILAPGCSRYFSREVSWDRKFMVWRYLSIMSQLETNGMMSRHATHVLYHSKIKAHFPWKKVCEEGGLHEQSLDVMESTGTGNPNPAVLTRP